MVAHRSGLTLILFVLAARLGHITNARKKLWRMMKYKGEANRVPDVRIMHFPGERGIRQIEASLLKGHLFYAQANIPSQHYGDPKDGNLQIASWRTEHADR